ncbi:uncharacterized protein [Physcomitrium patens]|uniref:uncharacterized protein n=1 Tax=Physcomitrium patens TaxID=3218 RepID=UPI00024AB8DF
MELLGTIGNYRELQGTTGNYVLVEYRDGLSRATDAVNSGDATNVAARRNAWRSEGGMDAACRRGGAGTGAASRVEVSAIASEINEGEDRSCRYLVFVCALSNSSPTWSFT